MAITKDDFSKIWASSSPLTPYEFSENDYKAGWNFIGATPPSRQMWDFLQKLTDEKIQYIYNNMIPCGIVQAFAGTTTPEGWLLCDGSAISRTDYAELYSVIGDTYGDGDGSTTFNLPNLIDKFVEGSATAGTVKNAGLPNISGKYQAGGGASQGWVNTIQGVFTNTSVVGTVKNTANPLTGTGDLFVDFDASASNPIYGNSATVQPPALTMRYIIKY